ncbi:hypothetical protein [Pseudarthrobacter sulfonivorans]|uniref:hypothetical protein n=1 Tax=Pseudarthrobacter sulfonivorans TaxID=121292 RepID=UPI00277ED85D|nr:hypothetical protein [Pseudarthrobacter sulfonivorans]MDQ0000301.1 hypothetical protein [Pseudarthrobacter sulfonivorans]
MVRRFKPVAAAMALAGLLFGFTACSETGSSRAERLKTDMQEAAMSVPGVASANVHVNMNTSGNFITAKLVGTGTDEATLAEALEGALPVMLEKTEDLKFGTFSTSIFSADEAISVGADALGYPGGSSLTDFREFFLSRP